MAIVDETARFVGLVALGTIVVGLSEKRSELLSDWLPDAHRVRLEGGRLAAPFALFCGVCVCTCVCVHVYNVFNVHDINLAIHLVLPVLFRHLQYEYLSTRI